MEKIGYSLVDSDNNEIQFWGDTAQQCEGIPNFIKLPNGDEVHCPPSDFSCQTTVTEVDQNDNETVIVTGSYRLVERWLQVGSPEFIAYSDGKIIVTRAAPPEETVEEKLARVGLTVEDVQAAVALANNTNT